MSESHTGGFHRPVQTLVDTFISFRVSRKRKEMRANPSFCARKGLLFLQNSNPLFNTSTTAKENYRKGGTL